MDFCAAAVFLFLLVAQAACAYLPDVDKRGAMAETIQLLREGELRTVLGELANPGLFRNNSCPHLNSTELGEPQEPSLTAYHLSSFRCYILKAAQVLSNASMTLSQKLNNISQDVDAMESLTSVTGRPARQRCSLPHFDDKQLFMHQMNYVRCLLQLLDQRLSSAKFSFH